MIEYPCTYLVDTENPMCSSGWMVSHPTIGQIKVVPQGTDPCHIAT